MWSGLNCNKGTGSGSAPSLEITWYLVLRLVTNVCSLYLTLLCFMLMMTYATTGMPLPSSTS